MKKCCFIEDLELTVKKVRLMTEDEFDKYNEIIPESSLEVCSFISHFGNGDNYKKDTFTEVNVLCFSDGKNMYIRLVIEIEGLEKTSLNIGDEIIYNGKFFTILDKHLAISSNFLTNKNSQKETIEEFLDNL